MGINEKTSITKTRLDLEDDGLCENEDQDHLDSKKAFKPTRVALIPVLNGQNAFQPIGQF